MVGNTLGSRTNFFKFLQPKLLADNVERYRSGHNGADSKSSINTRKIVDIPEFEAQAFSFGR